MQIKDFCETARKAKWTLNIERVREGYSVYAKVGSDVEYIDTQRAAKRVWKRLDVLVKNVEESGFEGDLNLQISRQQTL